MDAYKKSRVKSIICWVIAFALAIFYLVVSFLPFIFMVLNSFKEKFEMLTVGVFELPQSLNFANYQEVLTGGFGFCLLPPALLILWQDSSSSWRILFMQELLHVCLFQYTLH